MKNYNLNIRKLLLPAIMSLFCNCSLFSQSVDKQKLLDSLIVNKWKTEKVKVGENFLTLDKDQKESRLVFLSNHIAHNISSGGEESGKWELDAFNMKLSIGFGQSLKIRPLIFNIITLEKNRFVFSVGDDHSDHMTTFECIADES